MQQSFDADPLCYHGDVRARVGLGFVASSREFASAGILEKMTVPFCIWHAKTDSYGTRFLFQARFANHNGLTPRAIFSAVDPEGSQALYDRASSKSKTLKWCGPGLDVDADVWHDILLVRMWHWDAPRRFT